MTYFRYPLIYGAISGAVVAGLISAGLAFKHQFGFVTSMWFGYLVMLVALTFIFVGVKRYRDAEKGGVIRFLPALGMGLAIAGVAAIAYSLVWEAYLALTQYRFVDEFAAQMIEQQRAAGASAAEMAKMDKDIAWMREIYANPPARFVLTMVEILPVGIGIALVSAVTLMFPKVLPAR